MSYTDTSIVGLRSLRVLSEYLDATAASATTTLIADGHELRLTFVRAGLGDWFALGGLRHEDYALTYDDGTSARVYVGDEAMRLRTEFYVRYKVVQKELT